VDIAAALIRVAAPPAEAVEAEVIPAAPAVAVAVVPAALHLEDVREVPRAVGR